MADIPVEQKGGSKWWVWLLALLVVGGLIWLIAEAFDTDEAEMADVESITPGITPEPTAEAPAITIGDILSNPSAYVGQAFPGAEVNVAEVPTDRGFWIEDNGQRLFALIIDDPQEELKDINPGQMLRVEGGTLRDPAYLPQVPGDPLDQDTQQIAEQQQIFLVVDEQYINIVEAGTPQPGTDPAETAGGGQ